MTKFKFPEKYTLIDRIKRRLKKNPDVSVDQIKKYNSRALGPSGAFLMTHIDMIEELNRDKMRFKKLYYDEKKERDRLESCLDCVQDKYKNLEKNIIDRCGLKSFEYEVFTEYSS